MQLQTNHHSEDLPWMHHSLAAQHGQHADSLSRLSLIFLQLQAAKQTLQQNHLQRRPAGEGFTQAQSAYLKAE